ncbi:MAG: hypothetical protein K2X81_00005, partial [Candidatus Obscuribacterales bacterium]|nr:hypothetical protein [Candidatus Obscuribacterales bacterium]
MSSPQSAGTPPRFVRDKYFPSSWNSGEDRFCALFHKYAYIYKPLSGGNWLSAEEKWQLTDTEILKAIACAHQKFFIGARSGKASWFAVLDIDTKSKYHTLEQVEKIRAILKAAGIENVVPYRSSSSGGWHLYIFFDQPVSSRDLNKQLTLLLQLNKFKVEKGQLEIFPNPGTHGSLGYGLRLPMQPGWAWLNPETLEPAAERDEITAVEALGLFLLDMDTSSNKYHDFHQLKSHVQELLKQSEKLPSKAVLSPASRTNNVVSLKARNVQLEPLTKSSDLLKDVFGTIPPGIIPDVWEQGRSYYADGLTGPSQRADAIFSLGHYLFYGDPEQNLEALGYGCEQIRQELIEEIISSKHNGQSDDLNEGRSDALAQIRRASNWRPVDKLESTPYFDEIPISWILENAKRKRNARARIAQAVKELRAECRQLTATLIQSRAKCSWTTLYKHSDLWKEDWTQSPVDGNEYELIADNL